MKRGVSLVFTLGLIIFSLVFLIFLIPSVVAEDISSSGMTSYVKFNGDFENGTTLYSEPHSFSVHAEVWGRDAYPDKTTYGREYVCETKYRLKREKVCTEITNGYIERTRTICRRTWNNDLLIYETICQTEVYQIPKRNSIYCDYVYVEEPYEKCTWVRINTQPILCENPSGTNSNFLALENFKMSLDNSTWQDIPYAGDKFSVNDGETVYFKVEIPGYCSPDYFVDRAILIRTKNTM